MNLKVHKIIKVIIYIKIYTIATMNLKVQKYTVLMYLVFYS